MGYLSAPHPSRRASAPRRRSAGGWVRALAFERDPLHTLEHLHAESDAGTGAGMFPLRSLIAGRMLVIGTPELAREIVHARPDRFLTGVANRKILPVLPENTVLTLDADAYRARRRELAAIFSGEPFTRLGGQIGALISDELDRWPLERAFAVLPRLRSLTLRIVAALLLGVSDDARLAGLERCLAQALRPYAMLASHSSLWCLRAAGPQAAAAQGRHAFAAGLAKLLGGRLPPFGADETLALLLAGRDTTAAALAWALLQLAHEPERTEALCGRIAGGDHASLDALVYETLRLWPPLIDIVRQPTASLELAGRPIAAGTLLMACPILFGRSRAYPNPRSFHPGRFLAGRPDPRAWMPFGGGPHRCLGAPLAMLELREILARVLRRFTLSAPPGQLERPRLYGTAMIPSRGAQLALQPRTTPAHRS